MDVLAAASPLRPSLRDCLDCCTPKSERSSGSPDDSKDVTRRRPQRFRLTLARAPTTPVSSCGSRRSCASPGSGTDAAAAALVHYDYGSEDGSQCSGSYDGGNGLEEVYSFDRERVAELAHKGAGLAELTDAILMDMACSLERFLTSEQIEKMTVSGDGTLENVGIKVDGKFQCQHCSQKFDSKQQRQIHQRFVHPPQEQQVGGEPLEGEPEALLKQAVVCARRKHRRSMARAVRAADVESDTEKAFVEGQRVRCRDGGADWKAGVVTSTCPLKVRPDGRGWVPKGNAWDEVRPLEESPGTAAVDPTPSPPCLESNVDARIQRAVVAAMARREVSSVLPAALVGPDYELSRRRRRASIG